MNNFELGAGAVFALSIVGFIIWLWIRVRALESVTIVEKEKITDDKIVSKNHALSDAERDALLRTHLGDGNPKT